MSPGGVLFTLFCQHIVLQTIHENTMVSVFLSFQVFVELCHPLYSFSSWLVPLPGSCRMCSSLAVSVCIHTFCGVNRAPEKDPWASSRIDKHAKTKRTLPLEAGCKLYIYVYIYIYHNGYGNLNLGILSQKVLLYVIPTVCCDAYRLTVLFLRSRRYAAKTRVKCMHIVLILSYHVSDYCQTFVVLQYVLVPLPWQMAGYRTDLPPATVAIA